MRVMEPLTLKWEHGTVDRQATGHGDIYWCHVSNGPIVVRSRNNVCELCSQTLTDMPNKHSFVVHIQGPTS